MLSLFLFDGLVCLMDFSVLILFAECVVDLSSF